MISIINKSSIILLNLLIPVKDLTIEEFGKRRMFVSFLSIIVAPSYSVQRISFSHRQRTFWNYKLTYVAFSYIYDNYTEKKETG